MNIPDEFNYLVNCFWDGSIHEASSLDEWVSNAVRLVSEDKRNVVRPYLADLLSRGLNEVELQTEWRASGARFSIPDTNELRRFLHLINEKIAAPGWSP
jgi:hypothetical protein